MFLTTSIVVSAGTSCDFENGTCGWYNPSGFTAKWQIKSGKTFWYERLENDHTLGTTEGKCQSMHFLFRKLYKGEREHINNVKTNKFNLIFIHKLFSIKFCLVEKLRE